VISSVSQVASTRKSATIPSMRRRSLLRLAATTGLASLAPSRAAEPADAPNAGVTPDDAPEIVDTHTHFYDPGRPEGVPWPEPGSWLHRRVLPDDWAALARPHGITRTVVVEASDWVEDNQWLLDLAAGDSRIVGVVGNLDPMAPEFASRLRRFAAHPVFRGIRNRRPNAELRTLVDQPAFRTALRQLAEAGLALDVNIGNPEDLAAVARLTATLPDLRLVLDHVAGAGDPRRLSEAWKSGLRAAATRPGVYCKVSGLVEQTDSAHGEAPRDPEFYLPILDHVWDCFGEDRVIFGSNWPVSDRGAPFATVFDVVNSFFTAKGSAARGKFFLGNSKTAYRWIDR
jgi:L-fuconolactonase